MPPASCGVMVTWEMASGLTEAATADVSGTTTDRPPEQTKTKIASPATSAE